MSTAVFLSLAFISSLWSAQYQQSMAIRPPSESTIVHDEDYYPSAISPAMISFFHGNNRTAPPAANNSTVPKWRLPAPPLRQKDNGVRTIVLVTGIVCGAIGIGLLVSAAMTYIRHGRKIGPELRLGAA